MRVTRIAVLVLASLALSSTSAQYSDDESDGCVEAREEAEDAASNLASYASSLQQCAANEDYDDDCSAEFYAVQSAHSDYESAAGDVAYSCEY